VKQDGLTIETTRIPYDGVHDYTNLLNWTGTFLNVSQELEFQELKITNNQSGTRRIRIKTSGLSGEAWVYMRLNNSSVVSGTKEVIPNAFIKLLFDAPGRTVIAREGDYQYAALPPGDSLIVHVHFQFLNRKTCSGGKKTLIGLGLATTSSFSIEEMNEDNSVSNSWPVALASSSTMTYVAENLPIIKNYPTVNPSQECK
jgi:hypothetical protein